MRSYREWTTLPRKSQNCSLSRMCVSIATPRCCWETVLVAGRRSREVKECNKFFKRNQFHRALFFNQGKRVISSGCEGMSSDAERVVLPSTFSFCASCWQIWQLGPDGCFFASTRRRGPTITRSYPFATSHSDPGRFVKIPLLEWTRSECLQTLSHCPRRKKKAG